MPKSARLVRWLPLVLILGMVALACSLFWLSLQQRQNAQWQAARQRSEWRAKQLNEALTQQLDARLLSIDMALKHLRSVYARTPRDFDQAVRDVLATYPPGMIEYVTVFGPDGRLAYVSDAARSDSLHQRFDDREHFSVHAHASVDALFVSAPLLGRLSGVTLVQVTRGIWEGNRFRGVIGIPVQPGYLSSHLVPLQIDPTDILAVVRPDGSTIARSHGLEEALKSKLPAERPFLQGRAGDSGVFRSTSTYDKLPMLFSWQRLAQWPLITVAAINENAEMAPLSKALEQERRHALSTIVIVLAFSLGVGLLMMRIQGQNRWLARTEAEQRAILNSEISGIVKLCERKFLWMNQAFASMLGYRMEELMGQPTRRVYPDERSFLAFASAAYPTLALGKVYRAEVQFQRKDGSLAWFDVSGEP
ncbi:MAG: PAS domain S-box protein [Rhodoferax sp.]|nr:PAS domain S-box protein [Rhodoferax sp.]